MRIQELEDARYLLLFGQIAGVGQRRLSKLWQWSLITKRSLAEVWQSKVWPEEVAALPTASDEMCRIAKLHSLENYLELLESKHCAPVFLGSPEYPPLLATIDHPPILLFAKGELKLSVHTLPIAIVGTRKMTGYGAQVTRKIASEVVRSGGCVVSGCMYGVDVCAHEAALQAGGSTIGVLGYGFDYVFPQSQEKLMDEWLKTKRIVYLSPFFPHTSAVKANFPIRNAVVAGIARAVVVTEAAAKSGSHITATFAGEFGRAVCAVPGPITNPYSEGTKSLINDGATLVSSAADVLAEVGGVGSEKADWVASILTAPDAYGKLTQAEQKVVKVLQGGPSSLNTLVEAVSLSVSELSSVLLTLELNQVVVQQQGEYMLNL